MYFALEACYNTSKFDRDQRRSGLSVLPVPRRSTPPSCRESSTILLHDFSERYLCRLRQCCMSSIELGSYASEAVSVRVFNITSSALVSQSVYYYLVRVESMTRTVH